MLDVVTVTSLSKLIEILSKLFKKQPQKPPKVSARRHKISKLKPA